MKPFNRMGRRARIRDRRRSIELGLERCEDRCLLSNTFTVRSNSSDPAVTDSLPFVVDEVNREPANSGVNTINFALSVDELQINLTSALTLKRPVLIDGTNQAGAVTISEQSGSGNIDAFVLGPASNDTSGVSTIQNLTIVNFAGGAGIHVESAGATITNNRLGVTTGGTNGANQTGVFVDNVGQVTIGGSPAAANLIGFNTTGVSIIGTSATNNVVTSNFIGADSQNHNRANATGVVIDGNASNNIIGGSVAGGGNTIPSNPAANTIAFNTIDGVDVNSGNGNAVQGNVFQNNTVKDLNVAAGANNSVKAPTSLAYTSLPTLTTISYTITGTPGTYTLDFYASSGANSPAGVYLGGVSATIPASGTLTAATPFPLTTPLTSDQTVTATMTAQNGSTSNFAASASFSDPFRVTTASDIVVGSLRQAIIDADINPGLDTIIFKIGTGGPQTITLSNAAGALRDITDAVIIDGTTQQGFLGAPLIQIDGSKLSGTPNGLTLSNSGPGSAGSTIKGLEIYGFKGAGIQVQSAGNTIQTNYLGVQTQADGTLVAKANTQGIAIVGAANNVIGGLKGVGNLISGNSVGVLIQNAGATGNTVAGNLIGTNAAGTAGIANTSDGVQFASNASNNTVGGSDVTFGNVIAFNGGAGVNVKSGTGDSILSNAIFSNTGDGIALGNNANGGLVAPDIQTVTAAPSSTLISGQLLASTPAGDYLLQFFASQPGDSTTSDAAHIFLQTPTVITVTADGTHVTPFSITSSTTITSGQRVTATATLVTGGATGNNTSSFAAAVSPTTSFVVYSSASSGPGSLPAVVAAAEAASPNATATIIFNIPNPTHKPAVTITLSQALLITTPMIIDGTSEASFPGGNSAIIQISGGGGSFDGLVLTTNANPVTSSAGSKILGLDLVDFKGNAINVQTDGNLIAGNLIGTNPAATAAGPGNTVGILVSNASKTTIGGTAATAANTISFNTTGISITGTGSQNLIQGNLIGGAAIGKGNTGDGIDITTSSNNTIGGSATGAANTISFNTGAAVSVTTGTGNLISQNPVFGNGSGITLQSNGNALQPPASGLLVSSVPNGGSFLTTVQGSVTAGATPGTYTVEIFASNPNPPTGANAVDARTLIQSTTIPNLAANATQSFTLPFSTSSQILATQRVYATVTSPDGNTSIFAVSGSPANPFVVTTDDDTGQLGSLRFAINQADLAATNNTISFNLSTGHFTLKVDSANGPLPPITAPIVVDATSHAGITLSGLQADGKTKLVGDGLRLGGGGGITIQGLSVSNFAGDGILISSPNNKVQGLTVSNNTLDGILITSANNVIGGATGAAADIIVSNGQAGIEVQGRSATGNAIEGSFIGTTSPWPSTTQLGNGVGVLFTLNASNNMVGGTASGVGNVIAYNTSQGVFVQSGSGNSIRGNNEIVDNAPASTPPAQNPGINDIVLAQGANSSIPTPVVTAASFFNSATTVTLVLPNVPGGTQVVIEVFKEQAGSPDRRVFQPSFTSTPVTISTTNAPIQVQSSNDFDGQLLIVTATLVSDGSTSEFSNLVQVAQTIVVSTTADAIDSNTGKPLSTSLRGAIDQANNSQSTIPPTIVFAIPFFDSNTVFTSVSPFLFFDLKLNPNLGALSITHPVVINGFTEADYLNSTTQGLGVPRVPLIMIDGSALTRQLASMVVQVPASADQPPPGATVEGLMFAGMTSGAAILLQGGQGNLIKGNLIGTDVTGTSTTATGTDLEGIPIQSFSTSNQTGIVIDGSNDNLIGGPGATDRNLISGNTADGIVIQNGALRSLVENNYIGTDITGTTSVGSDTNWLGNGRSGVTIDNSGSAGKGNSIGGTISGLINVIAGNSAGGVVIKNGAANNVVQNSSIANDIQGKKSFNNVGAVQIVNAATNTVGSTVSGIGNTIGFSSVGVSITGASANGNMVEGSYIGTDSAGNNLKNSGAGILIDSGSNNAIGVSVSAAGAISGAGNTIGFNAVGVSITGSSAMHNAVAGNFIGTNSSANNLGNTGAGIVLDHDPLNTIGGSTFGTANVIGFNAGPGILINASTQALVMGNYIGTDAFNDKMGNQIGISIVGSSSNSIGGTITGTIGGTIGGSLAADQPFPAWVTEALTYTATGSLRGAGSTITGVGNIIGFNQGAGVSISGSSANNVLLGNLVGLNAVYQRPSDNNPTPPPPAFQNAGNLGDGIVLDGSGVPDNQNNLVGTTQSVPYTPTASGTVTPVLTLRDSYISVTSPTVNVNPNDPPPPDPLVSIQTLPQQNVTAGQPVSGTAYLGNIIAANHGVGVNVKNSTSSNSLIANTIGAASSTPGGGINPISGNTSNGISITNSSSNTIGSAALAPITAVVPLDGAANVVVGNSGDGISLTGGTGNLVSGNLVSFNTNNGIHFSGDLLSGTPQVQIVHNLVGTTSDGLSTVDDSNGLPQGNGLDGIRLDQTSRSTPVDGVAAEVWYNVSSNNALSGIDVQASGNGSSYAEVSIFGNYLGTDITGVSVSGPSRSSAGQAVPFGNALDGILLNEVLGVTLGGTAGQGNIVAGNLGRGIEVRTDNLTPGLSAPPGKTLTDLIQNNEIGLQGSGATTTVVDPSGTSLGNLSDGIFLLDPGNNRIAPTFIVIQGNTVSNNRGTGIHAVAGPQSGPGGLIIQDNRIGTDSTGKFVAVSSTKDPSVLESVGNGSDGVFLDGFNANPGQGALVTIVNNVISGNHANGVDLLQSRQVAITGNLIGTDINGFSVVGDLARDFGNASNGVFLNQSDLATIGGTAQGALNIISGNHASGVFISGTSDTQGFSASNVIQGNWIGVGYDAGHAAAAVPNAVAGVILSNAQSNVIGGSGTAANVISGNSLDGILLVNNANSNTIQGNLIGTDPTGKQAFGNTADGVFLLGSTAITIKGVVNTGGAISSNTISGNVISGNNQNGIQLFGAGAKGNTFNGNLVGLSSGGARIPNGNNGVLLNSAGSGNTIGGTSATQRNVISGNSQAGVEIINATTGTEIEGNYIGTSADGTTGVANGGPGVLIYGSSGNTIGGTTTSTGTGAGNLISGNAQAGVQIFNPGGTQADKNVIEGNLIGTNATGTQAIRNGSDGVQIQNGSNNTVGGTSSATRNVISGNAGNGVSIVQFPNLIASGNLVQGNYIGTGMHGDAVAGLGNLGSGVELLDGSGNTIGGSGGISQPNTNVPAGDWTGDRPGNVISGNGQWGVLIQLTGASTSPTQSSVEGNNIGMDAKGTSADGNGQGGVFVDNITATTLGQTIGGTASGSGNLISGNANVGIQLAGQQAKGNVIAGNLIGLDVAWNVVGAPGGTGNVTGILAQNSPNNTIGGMNPAARNVISGNITVGVEITGTGSSGNLIAGNFIGTDLTGYHFPNGSSVVAPAQTIGVLINGASGNTVGNPGVPNVISGNGVGVEIAGVRQSTGFIGGGNVVTGNLIGTDPTGNSPVSNLDLGVFVNNSASNTIGPGNVISANGIAGVELVSDGSSHNLVTGNVIGLGAGGQVFAVAPGQKTISSNGPEPGIPVFANAQLNGVVILGASNNTVGTDTRIPGSVGNNISGNVQVGVYITSRDFNGVRFSVPVGNTVSGNVIRANNLYGVLLFDAPNNAARPFTSQNKNLSKNTFGGEKTNFRNFQGAFDVGAPLVLRGKKRRHKGKASHVAHAPKVHHQPAASKQHVKAAHVVHPPAVHHGHAAASSKPHVAVVHIVHPAAVQHQNAQAKSMHQPAAVASHALLRARPRVPALFDGKPGHSHNGHKV